MIFIAILIITSLWILVGGIAPWRNVAHAAAAEGAGAPDTEAAGADATAAASEQPEPDDAALQPGRYPWPDPDALPKVSVISYVLHDEEEIPGYINLLLSQDYPALEVILVCDASAEATSLMAERYENVENLHITFIPPGSHNLSRRKLAQTIGIKAATGDIVVLTSSSVLPVHSSWVSNMVRPFVEAPATAAALGYVHPDLSYFGGKARWYRQFDYVLDSASWINAALAGTPYRCDGYNLAFRRSLFFKNKGYASTITLMDGDDDIFLREIARYGEVRMILSPQATLEADWSRQRERRYIDLKDRHFFTRRYLPRAPFLMQGALSCAQWVLLLSLLLSLAASAATFIPAARGIASLWPPLAGAAMLVIPPGIPAAAVCAAAALGTTVATWVLQTLAYRRMAAALGAARLFWTLLPFMLWRPVGNVIFNINHRTTRKSHFTWQR